MPGPNHAPASPGRRGLPYVVAAVATALGAAAVSGCMTPRGVPTGSSLVTEATVKSSFQAPTDGMLWIFRTPAHGARGQLHYSGPIGAGQVLVIDPSMNKATIDGQELELVLPGGDVLYQAYFRPDRSVRRVLEDRPTARRGGVISNDPMSAQPDTAATGTGSPAGAGGAAPGRDETQRHTE